MAFVILSTGGLAESRLHTVRARTVLGLAALLLSAAIAAGGMVGYRMGRAELPESQPLGEASPALSLDQPEGRALVDRVGELTGRLIRLESEALSLAKRLGVLQDFEKLAEKSGQQRKNPTDRPARAAKPRGGEDPPSGGPLLPAVGASVSDTLAGSNPSPVDDHDLRLGLADLAAQFDRLDAAFALVDKVLTERSLQDMAFPSRLPVLDRPITSGFGNRLDPFTRRLARHTGLDFPAPTGTPIYASAGGRVQWAGYNSDYGYMVEIDHGNGLVTRYAHASKLLVRTGQLVMPRQRIALVGSTGRSTGPHLHFEVIRNGDFADPKLYLARSLAD